jgi:glycosyltransferase involved in cell wall biosynthesis
VRIAIDASAVGRRKGGDETFMCGLLAALPGVDGANQYFAYTAETVDPNWDSGVTVRRLRPGAGIVRIPLRAPLQIALDRIDVYQSPLSCPPWCAAASVLYLPDVSFMSHPEHYPRRLRVRLQLLVAASIRASAAVLTLSRNARDEIVSRFPVARDRVFVAYPGVDRGRFRGPAAPIPDAVRERYSLPHRYVLYLGSINPRKNLVNLVRAHAIARSSDPTLPALVACGVDRWHADQTHSSIGSSERVRFTGHVSQEDLSAVVAGADMLVYPSFVEGFGLPPLEAMASGIPVIASRIPVFEEVYGGAYLPVNPYDAAEIAHGITRVHQESELRMALTSAGQAQALKYDWSATARVAVECYETARAARSNTVWNLADVPAAVRMCFS